MAVGLRARVAQHEDFRRTRDVEALSGPRSDQALGGQPSVGLHDGRGRNAQRRGEAANMGRRSPFESARVGTLQQIASNTSVVRTD